MGETISHCQGKGSLTHNNRAFLSKNVDKERVKDNITFVRQDIAEVYKELFAEATEKYNANQTRDERKKGDYFEETFNRKPCNQVLTSKQKQKSFYEDVVQVGTMNTCGVGTAQGEVAKECLIEYMQGFQKRNPQFKVFNAVLHMDEATPHLHIDYVPFADGYKNGLERQNGIAKALEQMGYGKGKNAISRWREAERGVFQTICEAHGIEIEAPKKSRGVSYATEEYKEIIHANQALIENQKQEIENNNAVLESQSKQISTNNDLIEKQTEETALLEIRKANAVLSKEEIPPRPKDVPPLNEGASIFEKINHEKKVAETKKKQAAWDDRYEIKEQYQNGVNATQTLIEALEKKQGKLDTELEEVAQGRSELQQGRSELQQERSEFEKEKLNTNLNISKEAHKTLERSERMSECMKISEAWKQRTGGIFERAAETMKGAENENKSISAKQDNNRTEKQKQPLRYQQERS